EVLQGRVDRKKLLLRPREAVTPDADGEPKTLLEEAVERLVEPLDPGGGRLASGRVQAERLPGRNHRLEERGREWLAGHGVRPDPVPESTASRPRTPSSAAAWSSAPRWTREASGDSGPGHGEASQEIAVLRALPDEDRGSLPPEDETPARRERQRFDENGRMVGEDGLDLPAVEHPLPAPGQIDHGEVVVEDLRPVDVSAPVDEDAIPGVEPPQLVPGPGVDVEERRGQVVVLDEGDGAR